MKEVVATAGVPTARARRLQRRRAGARLPPHAARPVRREDRRPGRGQGRARHRLAHRGRGRRQGEARRRELRRRRAHGRDRGGHDRPRAVAARRVRRPATPSPWRRRRTSSASATATPGPNTGGMGAYSPVPFADDGAGRRRDGPLRRPDAGRAAQPRHRLPRRALRRAHAHARRDRSWSSTTSASATPRPRSCCPACHRPRRPARRRGRRRAPRRPADVRRRRRGHRRGRDARATPKSPAPATVIEGLEGGGDLPGVTVFYAGVGADARRPAGHRRRPRARRRRRAARRCARPESGPTKPSTASRARACSIGPTSRPRPLNTRTVP